MRDENYSFALAFESKTTDILYFAESILPNFSLEFIDYHGSLNSTFYRVILRKHYWHADFYF